MFNQLLINITINRKIVVFLIFLLILIITGKDYLHNHSFNEDNDDCLVLVLNHVLNSGLINQYSFTENEKIFFIIFEIEIKEIDYSFIRTFLLRAPPLA